MSTARQLLSSVSVSTVDEGLERRRSVLGGLSALHADHPVFTLLGPRERLEPGGLLLGGFHRKTQRNITRAYLPY